MNNPTHALVIDYISKFHFKKKKINILDFGCGNGSLLKTMKIGNIGKYYGYDVNVKSIQDARDRYGSLSHVVFNRISSGVQYPKNIDIVYVLGVFQYVNNDGDIIKILADLKKTMRRNGFLVITACTDHALYRDMDLYGLMSPHRYFSQPAIERLVRRAGYRVSMTRELGPFLAPFFSSILSLIFDGLDIVFNWKKPGSLGRLGEWSRHVTAPLIYAEFQLPIDYGYTRIIIAKPAL